MTTLVTGWLPTNRASAHTIRSTSEYVLLARQLFKTQFPIIAFVHKEIRAELEKLALELSASVQFVDISSHTMTDERYLRLDELLKSGKKPGVLTNPIRDTSEYFAIQMSKADWIEQASGLTIDDELWWVDLGLAHVSPINPDSQLKIPDASKYVIACDARLDDIVDVLPAAEREQRRIHWPSAAGGMFGVRSSAAKGFAELWWQTFDELLNHELATTDELVLSHIAFNSSDVHRVNGIHQNLFESMSHVSLRSTATDAAGPDTFELKRPDHAHASQNSQSTQNRNSTSGIAEQDIDKTLVLADLPGAQVLDLKLLEPWAPGWSLFNPSVAVSSNDKILCLVRSSNYTIDGFTYSIVDDDEAIATHTMCVELDSSFNVINSFWIDVSAALTSEPKFAVHGIEDMRLNHDGSNWIVNGTIRQHDELGYCRQVIAVLDVERKQLRDAHIMPSPVTPWGLRVARVHEKNWMALPSTSENRQRFMWSADPIVTVEWDWLTRNLATVFGKPNPINTHALRGSTPFISTSRGLIAMVHEVAPSQLSEVGDSGPARRYLHRFIHFDERTHEVTKSQPVALAGDALEYAAGLAIHGDEIVVSFGQNDHTAHVLRIHQNEIFKLLKI